ncbi:hypothetical protein ITP53_17460 [Nonomuraea sp. K274]|uniref:Uncharacterized protein n=1 Tax=Nonomuraea cypriaca TaxID=1187855 RepID=A0A931EYN1_9ACTN|nr:hypothetical protein [Nonomuraea cypriaca]MBF8187490.1 hypothetical protein [Nonomuraea cypriaca]
MSHSQHEHDHDDHGEQAHSHPFVASDLSDAQMGQGEWPAVVILPRDAERDLAPVPMGRAPPRNHRGRAALTQTLEVCRC